MYTTKQVQDLTGNFEYSYHDSLKAGLTEAIGDWEFTVEATKKNTSFLLDENEHKQKTMRYFHPALFYCYKLL